MSPAVLAASVALAAPLLVVPTSNAANDGQRPPTRLWQQFPLNPTGQELRERPAVQRVYRPPVPPQASTPPPRADGTAPVVFACLAALLTFVLVFGALSAGARFTAVRRVRTGTPSERRPAAYVSAFFVGSRWLPVVEGIARPKPRPRRRTALGLGCALALLVGFLVLKYGG
jgi:hypothetical protein